MRYNDGPFPNIELNSDALRGSSHLAMLTIYEGVKFNCIYCSGCTVCHTYNLGLNQLVPQQKIGAPSC